MRLTAEDVRDIAALARVGMTDAEIERMRGELSDILDQFDVLQQADTEGVEPTGHSVDVETVMREDETAPSQPRDEMLSNAPLRERDFIRVKAVLEDAYPGPPAGAGEA